MDLRNTGSFCQMEHYLIRSFPWHNCLLNESRESKAIFIDCYPFIFILHWWSFNNIGFPLVLPVSGALPHHFVGSRNILDPSSFRPAVTRHSNHHCSAPEMFRDEITSSKKLLC
jgi:hypothetical protein